MKNSKSVQAVVASAVAMAMMGIGVSSSQAMERDQQSARQGVIAESGLSTGIPVAELIKQGFTIDEIEEAIADSPYVSIGEAPVANTTPGGMVSTQGVTFGTYIYVRISASQARAINAGSAAGAVAILGLATGGVGLVVAAVVYGYITELGNSRLSECARWEFKLTYPLPFANSRVAGAKCI